MRPLIVHVTAKIALRLTSVVTRLRVVILLIVVSAVLRHVKTALVTVRVLVLIVRPSMIVQIVVAVLLATRVTVIRVRLGAAMIAPRRVVNMLMLLPLNVVNSHHVLSVVIVQSMTSCRFSARRAWTLRRVAHAPSSRTTTALSAAATSLQALRLRKQQTVATAPHVVPRSRPNTQHALPQVWAANRFTDPAGRALARPDKK